jgi:hypothetical protein
MYVYLIFYIVHTIKHTTFILLFFYFTVKPSILVGVTFTTAVFSTSNFLQDGQSFIPATYPLDEGGGICGCGRAGLSLHEWRRSRHM